MIHRNLLQSSEIPLVSYSNKTKLLRLHKSHLIESSSLRLSDFFLLTFCRICALTTKDKWPVSHETLFLTVYLF